MITKPQSTLQLELLEQTLENAAREAALADGLITNNNDNDNTFENGDEYTEEAANDGSDPNNNGKGRAKSSLRRGKWTAEEESYATRLINEFKSGLLPLTDGTTLRTFLSKLLNCDPMRISKKFVGQNCIGKQVFRRRQSDLEKLSVEEIEASRNDLAELERRFLERVVQINRTKSAPRDGKNGVNEEETNGQSLPPWMMPPSESKNDDNEQSNSKEAIKNNLVDGNQQQGSKSKGSSKPKAKKNGKNNADSHLPPKQHEQPQLPRVSSVDYIKELVGIQSRPSLNRISSLELLPNMGFDITSAGSMENLQAYGIGMGNPTISSLWPSLNDLAEASKIVQASEQAENYKKRNRNGNGNGNRNGHGHEYQYVSVQSTTTYSNDVGYAIDSTPPLPTSRNQADDTDNRFGQNKRIKTENGEYELHTQNGGQATVLPKNSSIDNFWMLVNSGDIPVPSSSVLSESLIDPPGQNRVSK